MKSNLNIKGLEIWHPPTFNVIMINDVKSKYGP